MNRIGGGYTTSMYWFKLIEIHSKQLSCSGTYKPSACPCFAQGGGLHPPQGFSQWGDSNILIYLIRETDGIFVVLRTFSKN